MKDLEEISRCFKCGSQFLSLLKSVQKVIERSSIMVTIQHCRIIKNAFHRQSAKTLPDDILHVAYLSMQMFSRCKDLLVNLITHENKTCLTKSYLVCVIHWYLNEIINKYIVTKLNHFCCQNT